MKVTLAIALLLGCAVAQDTLLRAPSKPEALKDTAKLGQYYSYYDYNYGTYYSNYNYTYSYDYNYNYNYNYNYTYSYDYSYSYGEYPFSQRSDLEQFLDDAGEVATEIVIQVAEDLEDSFNNAVAKLMLRQGEVFPDYIDAIKNVFEAAKVNPGCDTDCAYDYCHEFGEQFFNVSCLNTTCGCTFNSTAIMNAAQEL